jgi:hypothetical protein
MKLLSIHHILTIPLCAGLMLFALPGCDRDSEAEDAAEDAGDAIEDAADEVGDAIEDAAE